MHTVIVFHAHLMRPLKKGSTVFTDISEEADEPLEVKTLPVEKEEETLVGSFTKLDVKPELHTEDQQDHLSSSQS